MPRCVFSPFHYQLVNSSRPSALHGLMTSQASSIKRCLSSGAALSRLMSRTRTRKTTRRVFVWRVRHPKLKVCLLLNVQCSTFMSHKDVSATADASVNKANSAPCASLKGKVWPAYTNVAYSSSGEVGILGQTDEVKVIIRKAIYFMEEFIIFENAFPDLATRAASARKALLKAVNHLIQSKPTHFEHYLVLKRRLKEDPEYVKSLSSVVREHRLRVTRADFCLKLEQRISNFRRSVRLTAAAAAGSAFRLHLTPSPPRDADSLVKDITNYICPLAANVSGIQSTIPSSCSPRERMWTIPGPSRMRLSYKLFTRSFLVFMQRRSIKSTLTASQVPETPGSLVMPP
jgi:hypothetical protein